MLLGAWSEKMVALNSWHTDRGRAQGHWGVFCGHPSPMLSHSRAAHRSTYMWNFSALGSASLEVGKERSVSK